MLSGMRSPTPASRSTRHPAPLRDARIVGGFWYPRLETIRTRTLPHIYENLERVGVIDAFRRAAGEDVGARPALAADSDLFKWIEAASCTLAWAPDPQLEAQLDELVELVASAQEDDGYLNTFYTVEEPGRRWTNLRDSHELYSAGHLFEAAVAHHAATGSPRLLDVARRFADHIEATFGREPGKRRGYCGHPEVELALLRLADATGDERYVRLAEYFVDERGREPYYFDVEEATRGSVNAFGEVFAVNTGEERRRYNQSHTPVVEQREMAGHAVRATYLYAAATEVAARTGDAELAAAMRRLFEDLRAKHLYITGGVGSSRLNEGFTKPYDLPNETAYAETCASIGLVFWAHRLARIDGTGEPLDVLERALYNTVLGGMSMEGTAFFYENHLADDGSYERCSWHDVACCPPNVARLLASLASYVYLVSEDDITVALFAESTARLIARGTDVRLTQRTEYPIGDRVRLTIECDDPLATTLRVRIPSSVELDSVVLDGEPVAVEAVARDRFLVFERTWSGRHEIELRLQMTPRLTRAHPLVAADAGRVAVEVGPLVHCVELPVGGAPPQAFELEAVERTAAGTLACLGSLPSVEDTDLYPSAALPRRPAELDAVPFYDRGNRGSGAYAVWLLDGTTPT